MQINIEKDLWHCLQNAGRPIVMYGMGNGADKILRVCEEYGIEVSDFFASDGFVRGHSFHGKRVLSYSEMKERYAEQEPIVLLSFASSRPEVLSLFRTVGAELELYAPDVPVFGETLFTTEFFLEHRSRFEAVWGLLADEESRRIFENVISYKLSGDISYLWDSESDRGEVFRDVLRCGEIESYLDLGAYNGDTIRELSGFDPSLKRVIALEPDARTFRKLEDYARTADGLEIRCINSGAWSECTTLAFDASGNRNSGFSASQDGKRIRDVSAVSVDSLLGGEGVDYIKYDVEGSERHALLGSAETIRKYAPKLLVSLYHRSEDMYELPELVHRLCGEYSLYLRRFPYIPAWDLNLYAIRN